MEQMAMPGSILITPDTLRLAEDYVVVKPLGARPVKGLEHPIEVYEIVGASAVRSRVHAAAARGLTRFVGRDDELKQLREALEQARVGSGQVMAVVGEAGVGKSRLFWEFIHSHRTEGWTVAESSSVSYGKATAYLPIVELLRAYFQIEARDDARKVREKLTGKLIALDRALEPALPALMWLLDVNPDDVEWQRLAPPQRRQQALDGVKALLLRESQVQPLLVLFEDLHWIDAETQALLDSLVESLPAARLLLLVNYRPEYRHTWSGKSYYRQVRLDPLPPESVDGLLNTLLGNAASLAPLKRVLIERTAGNPFFIEESVRTLIETGFLAGERGAFRLAKALETVQMPASARAILAARIDRLPAAEKRVLQAASVIGKDVPFALLDAIADESDDRLRQSLAQLQAAEFLYETRLFPDLEYTFRHALTYEVAYATLLHDRRRALHAGIVDVIERLYHDRLGEKTDALALHAFRGERWDTALAYLRQAGRKATSRCAFREAASYLEQALVSVGHLPDDPSSIRQAIDLRFDLRSALVPLGDLAPVLDHLREAERLALGIEDQGRSGRASSLLANLFQLTGQHDRALEAGERARAAAIAVGDRSLELATNLYLGQTYYAVGDYRGAVAVLVKNEEALRSEPIRDRLSEAAFRGITSRTWSVWALAELGAFAEGLERARESLRVAERVNHPAALVFGYLGMGLLEVRRGDFDGAVPLLDRSVTLCRTAGIPAMLPYTATALGQAYALSGRTAEALPLLEEAVAQAESSGMIGGQSLRIAQLGEGYLLAGRLADARDAANRALDLARAHKERGHEAWTLRLLGEIHSTAGLLDPEQAEAALRQAATVAEELGMRPLAAHCALDLGTLFGRLQQRDRAAEHFAAALGLFRDLDAPALFYLATEIANA